MRILFAGLILLLFLAPVLASAATYYVSTTGLDTNPGTQDLPWKTIQKAVDSVTPGSTIFVRNGTYMESVKITLAGTASLPINLTHYPGEKAVINGGSSRALYFSTQIPKYWIIDGLSFYSTNDVTVLWNSWGCNGTCNGIDHITFTRNFVSGPIQIYGAYNLIEGNEVDGTLNNGGTGDGVHSLYDVSHHNVFRNNLIHHFSRRGIWTMHRTHDDLIEGNIIHNCWAQCINTDGYSTVEWRHTVRNNTVYNCGMGIHIENTFNSTVENNIIYNITNDGMEIINYGRTLPKPDDPAYQPPWPEGKRCEVGGENNQFGDTNGDNDCEGNLNGLIVRQNLIYNTGVAGGITLYRAGGVRILGNTIYGNANSKWAVRIGGNSTQCPQIEMQSNIFAGHSESELWFMTDSVFSIDKNNLIYNANPNFAYQYSDGRTYWNRMNLSRYQANSGKGQNSLSGPPGFVNPNSGDFHLTATSPAVNTGINVGTSSDIEGNPRPAGAGYDIGAYEYVSSTPPPQPVPGDLTGDGKVDVGDLSAVATDFGKTSGFSNAKSDTNGDNIVDIFDIVYVASRFT